MNIYFAPLFKVITMYMGIENELSIFDYMSGNSIRMDDEERFQPLLRNGDYRLGNTSIRTKEGNGIYVDRYNLEVLTAPIAVRRGFSTRLINHLDIVRNRVIRSLKGRVATGYSIHWNISSDSIIDGDGNEQKQQQFWTQIEPIFNLFAQTPLSSGVRMRDKTEENRYELLGDSVPNRDQLRATALLVASFAHAYQSHRKHPIKLSEKEYVNYTCRKREGRRGRLGMYVSENIAHTMSLQDYAEITFKWLENYAIKLGTKDEFTNLQDFVYGRKELEVDKTKQYTEYNNYFFSRGVYKPTPKDYEFNPVITINKEAKVPIEGRLLGKFASKKDIKSFHWSTIQYEWKQALIQAEGVEDIYKHLQSVQKQRGFHTPWGGDNYYAKEFAFAEVKQHLFPELRTDEEE